MTSTARAARPARPDHRPRAIGLLAAAIGVYPGGGSAINPYPTVRPIY